MGWIPKESEGLERAWAAENNEACMIIGFFHFFGWYFLSFVLVTIILDRYWAFTLPLDAYPAVDRAKGMALVAGIASGLCSVPEVSRLSKYNSVQLKIRHAHLRQSLL